MSRYRHTLGRKLSEDEANVLLAMGVKDGDGIWVDPSDEREGTIMFDGSVGDSSPEDSAYDDWSMHTSNTWILHKEEIVE